MIYLSITFCVLLFALTTLSFFGKIKPTQRRMSWLFFFVFLGEFIYFLEHYTSYGAQ